MTELRDMMSRILSALVHAARHLRLGDTRANTTLLFAGALPVLIATAGLAFDFGTLAMKRSELQAAADQAATASAKQLGLASATDSSITTVATNFLANQLQGEAAPTSPDASTQALAPAAAQGGGADGISNSVIINHGKNAVTVQITENWTPFFAQFLNANMTPIVVSATAALQGESRLCALSLHPTDNQAFRLQNSAVLLAPSCGIYSNSTNAKGMVLLDSAQVTASVICSAGGVNASKAQTNVAPQIDCPPVPDPLADRLAPAISGCNYNNMAVKTGTVTLQPGVYCGGLAITNKANVTFQSGSYVIKDGPFTVSNNAAITGTDVSFYLSGSAAVLDFGGNASVDLSGAETGDMAGLLFFADRAQPDGTTHKINASNVKNLTGTIYLPAGDLQIQHNASMLATSAYTAIIANRFRLAMGPVIQMNTNYGSTKVPVPDGVRSAATVVLTN